MSLANKKRQNKTKQKTKHTEQTKSIATRHNNGEDDGIRLKEEVCFQNYGNVFFCLFVCFFLFLSNKSQAFTVSLLENRAVHLTS